MGAPEQIDIREADHAEAETVTSVRAQRAAKPLYVSRIKVHPRNIWGPFRRAKWAILAFCLTVYYVAPWLRWDRGPNAPDQALLIDLPGRRAYFFWIEIWPQEVYYLTGLLILAAIGLFLVTALLGRVWCGYACPQTVWTDLFMLIERLIEGDRNARIKLDKAPPSASKFAKRAAKHAAWLAIAFATGGAWVLYFQNAPTAVAQIFTGRAAIGTYFFVGLFTATTYTLAGWAREQVCTYMCPWPRFQSAMLDDQSLIVTYEAWRGKLKGGRKDERHGDCIDCMKCVAVCPTGIDIRDGQQLECIGCGLCIDACNTVMPVIGRPGNLIAFDTLANQAAEATGGKAAYRPIRGRTIIYAIVLLVVGGIMAAGLITRSRLDLDVLHERTPLFVALSGGDIRNGYTVRLLNKSHETKSFALRIDGLADYTLTAVGVDQTADRQHPLTLRVPPDGVETYRVYITATHATLAGNHERRMEGQMAETPIAFGVADHETGEAASHDSFFIAPASASEDH